MAYNEVSIKNSIKAKLAQVSKEVADKFGQEPREHLTEDEVNEKVAQAIAAAFTQFVKDAVIAIPAQQVAADKLTSPAGPVTGTGTLLPHTGSII